MADIVASVLTSGRGAEAFRFAFDDAFGEPTPYKRDGVVIELRWGSRGSLAADPGAGRWFSHEDDDGGGLLDALIRGGRAKTRAEAAKALEDRFGDGEVSSTPTPSVAVTAKRSSAELADFHWQRARPIEGTPAAAYLRSRAIEGPFSPALRFHSSVMCTEIGKPLPCMIAAIVALEAPGEIVSVQRTWLTRDGLKAPLEQVKKSLGPTLGLAVALHPFEDDLLIAEGVETAFSAAAKYGLPAAATLGTSGMRRVIVPPSVRRVLIAMDRDEAGECAAQELAARLRREGRRVFIVEPTRPHKDFNDEALDRAKSSASKKRE